MYNELIEILSKDSKILFDEPMSRHTTFKIGGNADCFVVANSYDDLTRVLEFAKEKNVPIMVIGNGSNLLVLDNGIRGIVVKLGSFSTAVTCEGSTIIAGAGASLSAVTQEALKNGLTGIEWAFGIPGTVGGAVFIDRKSVV